MEFLVGDPFLYNNSVTANNYNISLKLFVGSKTSIFYFYFFNTYVISKVFNDTTNISTHCS